MRGWMTFWHSSSPTRLSHSQSQNSLIFCRTCSLAASNACCSASTWLVRDSSTSPDIETLTKATLISWQVVVMMPRAWGARRPGFSHHSNSKPSNSWESMMLRWSRWREKILSDMKDAGLSGTDVRTAFRTSWDRWSAETDLKPHNGLAHRILLTYASMTLTLDVSTLTMMGQSLACRYSSTHCSNTSYTALTLCLPTLSTPNALLTRCRHSPAVSRPPSWWFRRWPCTELAIRRRHGRENDMAVSRRLDEVVEVMGPPTQFWRDWILPWGPTQASTRWMNVRRAAWRSGSSNVCRVRWDCATAAWRDPMAVKARYLHYLQIQYTASKLLVHRIQDTYNTVCATPNTVPVCATQDTYISCAHSKGHFYLWVVHLELTAPVQRTQDIDITCT